LGKAYTYLRFGVMLSRFGVRQACFVGFAVGGTYEFVMIKAGAYGTLIQAEAERNAVNYWDSQAYWEARRRREDVGPTEIKTQEQQVV